MAKTLEDQITAALRPSSRIVDVKAVITSVQAQIVATTAEFETQTALSISPALTVPQAREARNTAADLEHDLRRLNASLDLLVQREKKLIGEGDLAARRERYAAAAERRDRLVQDIKTIYPVIAGQFYDLVRRIEESDAECEDLNRGGAPWGSQPLVSAEILARGCDPNLYWPNNAGPVQRLGRAVVPFLTSSESVLPAHNGYGEMSARKRGAFKQALADGTLVLPGAPASQQEAA